MIKQARVVGLLRQKALENVKKGLEVNKFGGVIDIKLGQVTQYLIFDIGDQLVVGPYVVKSGLEVRPVAVAIYDQIELYVRSSE